MRTNFQAPEMRLKVRHTFVDCELYADKLCVDDGYTASSSIPIRTPAVVVFSDPKPSTSSSNPISDKAFMVRT